LKSFLGIESDRKLAIGVTFKENVNTRGKFSRVH
jgi:hypothetical protein